MNNESPSLLRVERLSFSCAGSVFSVSQNLVPRVGPGPHRSLRVGTTMLHEWGLQCCTSRDYRRDTAWRSNLHPGPSQGLKQRFGLSGETLVVAVFPTIRALESGRV